jgi:hypothetical protein
VKFAILPVREVFLMKFSTALLTIMVAANIAQPLPAFAWGDDGHKVVALIAQSFLDANARKRIDALLAADTDSLTPHDIASEATWADKYRGNGGRQTAQWHFVDIEIKDPNLDKACFNHPAIPPGTVASDGPAADCVVDKIDEFAKELTNPNTDAEEQIVALKFLLHFVGDIHQPLHSSDDNDRGGNNKKVSAAGFMASNLHHYWDTEFVDRLGSDPKNIATDLIGHISKDQLAVWQAGSASNWALDSFKIAKVDVYGLLPEPSSSGSFRLPTEYVSRATSDVAVQLSKAGVRLAFVLNNALRKQ